MKSNTNAFAHISARRSRPWEGEEEVRIAWVSALEASTGKHFDAERLKKDSSYNNVVIEFKAPGFFKGSTSSAKFREAMQDRLLPYIKRSAKKTGIPPEDFIGIAIDGDHVCFAQVKDGVIYPEQLLAFSPYSVALVEAAIYADTRRAITVDNLLADFGLGSKNAQSLMQAMSDALAVELRKDGNSKIKMLFEEWRTLYGQVADMSVLQAEAISQEMAFSWNGNDSQAMSGRLFVIHSYNSLLIKLLAAEIISAHGLTATKQPSQSMAGMLKNDELLNSLEHDIERAGIFAQANINGFVEEAIFSWYLDVGRMAVHAVALMPALRGMLGSLSLYRTDRLNHTRDVLRDLYQGLVPAKLRQSLGEFYTPDWLVDLTVGRAKSGAWLTKRVLDPTCGSGAFLVAIVRAVKAEAQAAGWSASDTVTHLCESVWGFDLNPLAVQTARVNFLMEIAGLLRLAPGHTVEIPVLLADAIYSPASTPTPGESTVKYRIGSQVAGLEIELPYALAFDRVRLDQVFELMGQEVEKGQSYSKTEASLKSAHLLTSAEAIEWRAPLKYTYDQVLNLHRLKWNGIWFRIVRNFFWSATAGQFDMIVGNPPWVRWSKLPDAYRERVKPTCERYGIFSKTKRHGGNELDISAMITYTTSDKWLKVGGRLAFVITGAVFKNPSSAGFRHFTLDPSNPNSLHLRPISVDDMKDLKPFADASNHTTVVVFEKAAKPVSYPIPYRLWSAASGNSRAIPTNLPLTYVKARVDVDSHEAAPVEGLGSPWSVLPKGRFQVLKALAGTCEWVAGRKGITTDLNAVFFVPIMESNGSLVKIASRPDAGRKKIGPAKSAWVEPTLLYPLVKGAGDFESCYVKAGSPSSEEDLLFTFVPNRGIDKEDYSNSEASMNTVALSKTRSWFKKYQSFLEERSTYRLQMKGAPPFAVYNVGDYTFQPWKVVWPEMSTRFYAAVVGSAEVPVVGTRPYVPDHKVYFAAFDDKQAAHYLCGLLNTPMVKEWIQSHTVSIQKGDVFKHMRLPEYDGSLAAHTALAKLVERAHAEHDANKRAVLVAQVETKGEDVIIHWIAAGAK